MEEEAPALERSFRGHRGAVNGVAFVPSMRQLVSGGADGDVLVWHFKATLRAWRYAGHTAAVHSVAHCAQSGLVASASQDNTVVRGRAPAHAPALKRGSGCGCPPPRASAAC